MGEFLTFDIIQMKATYLFSLMFAKCYFGFFIPNLEIKRLKTKKQYKLIHRKSIVSYIWVQTVDNTPILPTPRQFILMNIN